MSYSNTGFQATSKTNKALRGQLRDEPSYETYADVSFGHGGRKDQRRQRMESSRRKMLASVGR